MFAGFIIFNFLIAFFAPRFIPYLGFFPYKEILPGYHLPDFISKFANFDGVHYLLIAQQGYMQYEQAYFPLYPLLIKLLNPLFLGNTLLTGLVISNLSLFLGLIVFSKYLKSVYSVRRSVASVCFLLLFPTSFFFNAVYTESLFFLLFIASIYFLKKENYFLAAIFAFLASLTRLIGVFLIIPFAFHLFKRSKQSLTTNYYLLTTLLSPIIGLFAYMTYLWLTVKDPLYFLTSQPVFGAQRSTSLIILPQVYWRYIKIFFTAAHDFRYYISLFEFFVFTFIFIVLILDLFGNLKFIENWKLKIGNYNRLALNLFSFANLLLPTLTGTFSSIPRYALLSFSAFIFLGELKQTWIKLLIAAVFIILHILMLGYFVQGYFIG